MVGGVPTYLHAAGAATDNRPPPPPPPRLPAPPELAQAAVATYRLAGPGAAPPAPWKAALLEGLVWRALAGAPGRVVSVEVLGPDGGASGGGGGGGGVAATPTTTTTTPAGDTTTATVRVRGVGDADALTRLWVYLGANATAALNAGVAAGVVLYAVARSRRSRRTS